MIRIYPRHIAAALYTIEAVFLLSSWFVLFSPLNEANEMINFILNDEKHHIFYASIAAVTTGAILLAIAFLFSRTTSLPTASALAAAGLLLFALSVWQLDLPTAVSLGVASLFSLLNVRSPDRALNRTP